MSFRLDIILALAFFPATLNASTPSPKPETKNPDAEAVVRCTANLKKSERRGLFKITTSSQQSASLLQEAEHAEKEAKWHEQRQLMWEDYAKETDALGDAASAREPLAGFIARTHENQKEKQLERAQRLRQVATCLQSAMGQ